MTAWDKKVPAARAGDADTVRAVFDALGLMIASCSGPELTVVAANAAFRSFAGRQDMIGRPLSELFPEREGRRIAAMSERVYASGEREIGREWRIQGATGGTGEPREFFVDFVVDPFRDPDNQVTGIIGYAIDVTTQVRAREAARAEAAAQRRRREAARDVVTELQGALLPRGLPVLPRAQIAARYAVAEADQAAGGDWFDALPLEGGVALVVGDVVGHGAAASAAMGQLRAVLRHVLAIQPDLSAALAEVESFAAAEPPLRAATLCVAVLDPDSGDLRYVTCGHPPPLVVMPHGATRCLPATGSGPLGTGSGMGVRSAVVGPGEILLLYSDGLVQRPGRGFEDELAAAAGDAAAGDAAAGDAIASPAERVCQLAIETLVRAGHGDDATTLAAQRLDGMPATLEAELPADPGSVVVLRRRLDAWLRRTGVEEANRQLVELAVTEVVTNAVEHAYPAARAGSVRLAAALGADGFLEVKVTDRGQWHAPDPAVPERGRGLMLARQIADELRVSHPPQDAAHPPGARGTVITLRCRLRRLATPMPGGTDGAPPALVPFAAELTISTGRPRMRVTGPVDMTTAGRFASRLLSASRVGTLSLTVDLNAVTILASAGVCVLDQVSAQLAAHGQRLTLIAGHGSPAAAVLDVIHLPHASVEHEEG